MIFCMVAAMASWQTFICLQVFLSWARYWEFTVIFFLSVSFHFISVICETQSKEMLVIMMPNSTVYVYVLSSAVK